MLLLAGCSAHPQPTATIEREASDISTPTGSGAGPGLQSLYRVRYSGPQGSGGLRLILRQESTDRFQLSAADPLGRALWALDFTSGEILWIDHRGKTFCEGKGFALVEPALQSLPLPALPRVLRGLPPWELEVDIPVGESVEFTDKQGRQWRFRRDEQGLAAWTLWIEGAPTLWWTREGTGGILSHRDGSQFRWRRIVEEAMEVPFEALQTPTDYQRIRCDAAAIPELREGQP